MLLTTLLADSHQEIFGEIKIPQGVKQYNIDAGGGDAIGLILFISRLITVVTIVAGIFAMFNIIHAGFIYLSSSGDSASHGKVRDKITYSVIGLLIIVVSYTLAGLIGIIVFGDPRFIINPQLVGPAQ